MVTYYGQGPDIVSAGIHAAFLCLLSIFPVSLRNLLLMHWTKETVMW